MKFKFFFSLIFLLTFSAVMVSAQAVVEAGHPFKPGVTLDQLLSWQTGLAAVLMSLLTYIAPFLPVSFLQKAAPVVKYVTVAVTVGLLLLFLGVANGWQLALSFLLSSIFYSNVLSPLGVKTYRKKIDG